jgi:hypothetical protein
MRQSFKFLFLIPLLFSCMSSKQQSIDALTVKESSLKERQIQSRIYETNDEESLLLACANLLQDLSYQIEESESHLGVITATRDKSAIKTGQVALSILSALAGSKSNYDQYETIFLTVVVKPQGNNRMVVRATFQHIVKDNEGRTTANKQITDPKVYQEFFDLLSKSIFLEAHPYS